MRVRFYELDKIKFDLYNELYDKGYPAGDVRYAITKAIEEGYDSCADIKHRAREICIAAFDDTWYEGCEYDKRTT